MDVALLFPNQLFETKYLPYDTQKIDMFILTETMLDLKNIKHNLLRLIYQRASMKYYYDYLISKGCRVKYLDYGIPWITEINDSTVHVIDPVDRSIESSLKQLKKIKWYESPLFLSSSADLDEYIAITNSIHFNQHRFYVWQRKRLDILMNNGYPVGNTYSFDKYNRKPFPKHSFDGFVEDNKIDYTIPKYSRSYYDEAIVYCEKNFVNHYKNNYDPSNVYFYPITHVDSKRHFMHFINEKLKYFGDYQDAIDFNEPFLFHSVISIQLNNGLLNPKWVLRKVIDTYSADQLNNIEGFIRQLFWREYARMLYVHVYDRIKQNFFGHERHLSLKWYNGTTGIEPLDLSIRMAFRYGYLHHIIRLMVICNMMNLCHINPHDAYNWFMEFSLDSYDWVMVYNVYSMGLYADGGISTTKPYISSSNYIVKQSGRKGAWCDTWNLLYRFFVYKYRHKLKGRIILHTKHMIMTKTEIKKANDIINSLTDCY